MSHLAAHLAARKNRFQQRRGFVAQDLFVQFGKLAAKRHSALGEHLGYRLERGGCTMGRL